MQGKELQETGLYSYGWRDYMPDIGRWNGIDQLAESYLSTSPYAYVANNPVSQFDVDGRWMDDNGHIDTSGNANPFRDLGRTRSLMSQFAGQNPGEGSAGGYTFTGKDAFSMFSYFKNGGTMSGLSFGNNGVIGWIGNATLTSYSGTDIHGDIDLGVGYFAKFLNDGLLGLTNDIEGASHSLMKYQTEDFFKDSEKHLNGQLGNANMIIDEYNKLSNINKIKASTFLSAVSGIRAGKILRSTEGFMKSAGKISKRLGYVGTALTAGVTLYEFGTDTWDAHSVVNLGLLGATAIATFATAPVIVAAAPAILAGIAIYGVADYMFGVGDQLDKSIGRKSTIWYP